MTIEVYATQVEGVDPDFESTVFNLEMFDEHYAQLTINKHFVNHASLKELMEAIKDGLNKMGIKD